MNFDSPVHSICLLCLSVDIDIIHGKSYKNSLCITPGLVFDNEGYRIGYGKGYYDRFFNKYDGVKIGITYKDTLLESVPHEEYDNQVDFIITD